MNNHKTRLAVENRNNTWFYLYLIGLLLLIMLRVLTSVPVPVTLVLLLSFIPAVVGTRSQMLAFAVSCIPLSTAFQYKYAILICIIFYALRSGGKIKLNHIALAVAGMMVWELFHAFMGEFSFMEYLRGFAELLLLAVVAGMDMEKTDRELMYRSLALCTVGVCVTILLIQMKESGWSLDFVTLAFRFGAGNVEMENFNISFNPNRMGFICNLSLSGLLILASHRKLTAGEIVLAVLLITFGVLTLSRTFLVCLAVVALGFIFSTRGTAQKKLLSVLSVLAAVGVCLVILFLIVPETIEAFVLRFQEKDLLNGRDTLFSFYNKHIWSSGLYCLFGIGLQDFVGKIRDIYGTGWLICHNGYQQVWVTWGIVGMVLLGYLVYGIWRGAKTRARRISLTQCIPMLLIMVYVVSSQLISSGPVLLGIVYAYISMTENTQRVEEENTLSEKEHR